MWSKFLVSIEREKCIATDCHAAVSIEVTDQDLESCYSRNSPDSMFLSTANATFLTVLPHHGFVLKWCVCHGKWWLILKALYEWLHVLFFLTKWAWILNKQRTKSRVTSCRPLKQNVKKNKWINKCLVVHNILTEKYLFGCGSNLGHFWLKTVEALFSVRAVCYIIVLLRCVSVR